MKKHPRPQRQRWSPRINPLQSTRLNEMKRLRQSERVGKVDRLSDLPDFVLLHIMNLMNTKHAVQTCVLSTRWKDLWKRLTNLTLDSAYFRRVDCFSKFVSLVLSGRDGSISLHNVNLRRGGFMEPRILNKFINYVVSHGIQQLTLGILSREFPSCIFACQSLTFLNLSFLDVMPVLAKSFEFPLLKVLRLQNVAFRTSEDGCAEPFSKSNMLNSLVIDSCCALQQDKVLYITNSKLCGLTICDFYGFPHNVVLCTPKLSSLTTKKYPIHQLSSVCDLPFLEEVNIDAYRYRGDFQKIGLVLFRWLQVLANVTVMTLSLNTLDMLHDLSNLGSMRIQLPCFVRLKSVKVNLGSTSRKSDEEVIRIMEYLPQNSPPARVEIIRQA